MFYNIALEENVMGMLIYNPKLWQEALVAGVNENTFYNQAIAAMCRASIDILNQGLEPDLPTLCEMIPVHSQYMIKISDSSIGSFNFEKHINALRNLEAIRVLKKNTEEILGKINDSVMPGDADEMIASMEATRNNMEGIVRNRINRKFSNALDDLYAKMGVVNQVLPLFDKNTIVGSAFSFHAGELMTVSAATGTGKTAMGCQMARTMILDKKRVLYVCTESTDTEIAARMVASITSVPHYVSTDGGVAGDVQRFKEGIDALRNVADSYFKVIGLQHSKPNAADIERALREYEQTQGPVDCVIIDYIQDIGFSKDMAKLNKFDRLEMTVDRIHDMCIQRGCAAIFLSQLNRTGAKDELPTEDQIKASSLIAEKSHIVSFLHRRRSASDESISETDKRNNLLGKNTRPQQGGKEEEDYTRFYSVKCRNTKMFDVKLAWDRTYYVDYKG